MNILSSFKGVSSRSSSCYSQLPSQFQRSFHIVSNQEIYDLGIQIAAAAEQQSTVTEEINRNLASCNEQLVAIVKQFKLE